MTFDIMASWHLTELRTALETRGWRLVTELPGDHYAISGTWECRRAGDARVLLLDFEGLDDMKALPLAESYACRARGTSHVLSFRRRGESGSSQRARWNSELVGFVEVVSNAAV
jgi:hypothetical protein